MIEIKSAIFFEKQKNYKFADHFIGKIVTAARRDALIQKGVNPQVVDHILSIRDQEEQTYLSNAAFRNPNISIDELRQLLRTQQSKTQFPGQERLVQQKYPPIFRKWLIIKTKPFFKNGIPNNLEEISNKLNEIFDWYQSEVNNNPRFDLASYDWDLAIQKSDSWHSAFEVTDGSQYQMHNPSPVIYAPDEWEGWSIKLLEDENDFMCEGDTMGHCVGGGDYYRNYKKGDIIIVSLRDPNNVPHATLEIKNPAKRRGFESAITKAPKYKKAATESLESFFKCLNEKKPDFYGDHNHINLEEEGWNIASAKKIMLSNLRLSTGNEDFDEKTRQELYESNQTMEDEDSDDYYEEGYNVVQTQGTGNSRLLPQYQKMVDEFLADDDARSELVDYLDNESVPSNLPKELIDVYKAARTTGLDANSINALAAYPDIIIDLLSRARYLSDPTLKDQLIQICANDPYSIYDLHSLLYIRDNPIVDQVMAQNPEVALLCALNNYAPPAIEQALLNSEDPETKEAYILLVKSTEEGQTQEEKWGQTYTVYDIVDKDSSELEEFVLDNPDLAWKFAFVNNPTPGLTKAVLQNLDASEKYLEILQERWNNPAEVEKFKGIVRTMACNEGSYEANQFAKKYDDSQPTDETRNAACTELNGALVYARDIDKGFHPTTFHAILQAKNPRMAAEYLYQIKDIPQDAFSELFQVSLQDPRITTTLAGWLKKEGRDLPPEMMAQLSAQVIYKPQAALEFAREFAGPTDALRYAASLDPDCALKFAQEVDQGPHPVTRWGASREPMAASSYARGIDHGWHPILLKAVEGQWFDPRRGSRDWDETLPSTPEEMEMPQFYQTQDMDETGFQYRKPETLAKSILRLEKSGQHKIVDRLLISNPFQNL